MTRHAARCFSEREGKYRPRETDYEFFFWGRGNSLHLIFLDTDRSPLFDRGTAETVSSLSDTRQNIANGWENKETVRKAFTRNECFYEIQVQQSSTWNIPSNCQVNPIETEVTRKSPLVNPPKRISSHHAFFREFNVQRTGTPTRGSAQLPMEEYVKNG